MRHLFLAALLFASPASAQLIRERDVEPPKKLPPELQRKPEPSQPWIVRMMIHPMRNGMFIGLPIIDTNPNRGATYGFMPIWVFQNGESGRIRHIHAPSISYNPTFQWEPTLRYYFYPTEKASYFARAALSGNRNKDVIGEMEDLDFLGKDLAVNGRVAYDIDGSKRFYGIGPDTPEGSETNYTRTTIMYWFRVGLPIFEGSRWKFNIGHHLAGERIDDGVIDSLTDINARFPSVVPAHFHQDSELQLFMDYDTRDTPVTTTRGSYLKFMLENSQREFGSEFVFSKYTVDLRHFHGWEAKRWGVTAARFRYEQLNGGVPFYLLPSLGGKENHRAYGDGRYRDKGMAVVTLEQRVVAYSIEMAGVTTALELAPFIGVGSVFRGPHTVAARYLRPAWGLAFRAVAYPQVVGSVDLGVGQEGPTVFMDIGYSF